MKDFLIKNHFTIILMILGAVGGFLYWRFVGCQLGTCIIKSVWYLSTVWGMLISYLIGNIIKDLVLKIKTFINK
jgi:hypothetical protein